jgi:hypothetical protein
MPKDFSFQNLSGANFSDANLQHADFMGADLQRADFMDANLESADLESADLQRAYLVEANLQHADMRRANLQHAYLRGANLDGALIDYQIEEGLLLKVAQHALQDGALDMSRWHTCDTTHCIAGWAEHLSEKTRKLAASHGHEIAGLLTLGHEAHKFFWASDDDARKFLQSVVAKG